MFTPVIYFIFILVKVNLAIKLQLNVLVHATINPNNPFCDDQDES